MRLFLPSALFLCVLCACESGHSPAETKRGVRVPDPTQVPEPAPPGEAPPGSQLGVAPGGADAPGEGMVDKAAPGEARPLERAPASEQAPDQAAEREPEVASAAASPGKQPYRFARNGSSLDGRAIYGDLDLQWLSTQVAEMTQGRADSARRAQAVRPQLPQPPRLERKACVTSRQALEAEIQRGSVDIVVGADLAGQGMVQAFGSDYQLRLPAGVTIDGLAFSQNPNIEVRNAQRVRIVGPGTIGAVWGYGDKKDDALRVQDIVFDGVTFNATGELPVALGLSDSARVAVVNSVMRGGPPGQGQGAPFYFNGITDLVVANTNMMGAPDARENDWCLRLDPSRGTGRENARVVVADIWCLSRYRHVYRGDSHHNHSIVSTPAYLKRGYKTTFINLHFAGPIATDAASDGIFIQDVRQVMGTVEMPASAYIDFGGARGGKHTLWRARRLEFRCRHKSNCSPSTLAKRQSESGGGDWDFGLKGAEFSWDAALDPRSPQVGRRIPQPPPIVSPAAGKLPISDPRRLPAPRHPVTSTPPPGCP